jgi:cell division protein FtsZ
MAKTDLSQLRLVALHTSARVLEMTDAPEKRLIGAELTHGLGAGGDPSLARAAAERDVNLLRELCQDADLIFIVAGLGGGTGTGVAPVLARVAKESGALVLGVATLPFDLEGVRRRHHAEKALIEFIASADSVIRLPNQKIFQLVDEKTSVLESLKITNDLLAQGIRGIWQMLTRPGLIHVDFADLCSVLRGRHAESSFASAQAQGEARAREVIEQVLACPLLEGGQILADAEAILVNVVGGPDLSMADIKRIMDEINRRSDNTRLVLGASVIDEFRDQISLTLVAAHGQSTVPAEPPHSDRRAQSAPAPISLAAAEAGSPLLPPLNPGQPIPDLGDARSDRGHKESVELSGRAAPAPKGRASSKSPFKLRQGHLALEMVSKGRFEKSHPTIHRGEDLDVPTYVRRGIPLN